MQLEWRVRLNLDPFCIGWLEIKLEKLLSFSKNLSRPWTGKIVRWGGTFINYNCWFDLGDDIEIGENCNIAMNVHFINGTHEIGDENRRAAQGITKRIVVGAGSWIGADTIIMPGVTIGKGVVVGTGSLVTTDLEDNAIYFGRPARLYKKL